MQLTRGPSKRAGAAAVAVGLALGVVPATAEAVPRTVCVSFTATGSGQDLGGGRTEAVLFVDGRRIGTTVATFALAPGSGTQAAFTGPLTYTPDRVRKATLVAQLDGTFDVATGEFSARSTAVTGTGVLRRVSGDLSVQGVEDLTDGSFTETLTGRLCTPVSGRRALERALG